MDNLITLYLETKDITYLHQWVEGNLKFFHDIVHKTVRRNNMFSVSKEDLFSEAIIIFYDTIDKFDPQLGGLTTYMYRVIGNGLINKITHENNKDFSTRVGAMSLDRTYESGDGSVVAFEEIATIESNDVMVAVLTKSLDSYVSNNLPLRKQHIYKLYKSGLPLSAIANNVGVTKQYVSKVLKDLVEQVRKEWQV